MSTTAIDNELQKKIATLSDIQKESLLKLIDSFTDEADIDIAAYNQELEEANKEIEQGNFLSHKQALKLIND